MCFGDAGEAVTLPDTLTWFHSLFYSRLVRGGCNSLSNWLLSSLGFLATCDRKAMLNNLNVKEQGTFFPSFCLCYCWASGRSPQVRTLERDKKKKDHKHAGERWETKRKDEFDGAAPSELQTCYMSQLAYTFVPCTETAEGHATGSNFSLRSQGENRPAAAFFFFFPSVNILPQNIKEKLLLDLSLCLRWQMFSVVPLFSLEWMYRLGLDWNGEVKLKTLKKSFWRLSLIRT